jgi:hypothetical protein
MFGHQSICDSKAFRLDHCHLAAILVQELWQKPVNANCMLPAGDCEDVIQRRNSLFGRFKSMTKYFEKIRLNHAMQTFCVILYEFYGCELRLQPKSRTNVPGEGIYI